MSEAARLYTIAVVAESFHQLPSVVARDLDEDPERLALACLPLLRYAEAFGAFKAAKDEQSLEHWKGSSTMDAVKVNAMKLSAERRKRKAKEKP